MLRIWKNKFNLISHQLDIDKIYLYVKDSYEDVKDLSEVKYQLLINKRENTGLTHLDNFKAFIECSDDIDNIYKIIKEYNPNKQCKMLIDFLMIWLVKGWCTVGLTKHFSSFYYIILTFISI